MGTNPIVLDEKLRNLSVIEVGLDILGSRVKKVQTSSDYKGLCFRHNGKRQSFYLKAKFNKYVCFGCNIEGTAISLPFRLYSEDTGLKYFECKLGFDRMDIMEMAVFKWHAKNAEKNGEAIPWHFLEEFEPLDDTDKLEFGLGSYFLPTLYRAALDGARNLDDYLGKLEQRCTE